MEREFYLDKNIWKCPKCGYEAHQYVCGNCGFKIYAGIRERFLAHLIDYVFLTMVFILLNQIKKISPAWYLISFFFEFLVLFIFHIILVSVWGQTLGKMLCRIKIVLIDGNKLRWSNAWRRVSVDIGFVVFAIFLRLIGLDLRNSRGPFWAMTAWVLALLIYKFSDTYVLLKNEKQRAIHDLIGGTVVIHDPR